MWVIATITAQGHVPTQCSASQLYRCPNNLWYLFAGCVFVWSAEGVNDFIHICLHLHEIKLYLASCTQTVAKGASNHKRRLHNYHFAKTKLRWLIIGSIGLSSGHAWKCWPIRRPCWDGLRRYAAGYLFAMPVLLMLLGNLQHLYASKLTVAWTDSNDNVLSEVLNNADAAYG